MIELKQEVNALCGQTGQPPHLPLAFDRTAMIPLDQTTFKPEEQHEQA
jgi:hypothetical protein